MSEENTGRNQPGLLIETISVTPQSDDNVNPPIENNIISPDKVKAARLMIGHD